MHISPSKLQQLIPEGTHYYNSHNSRHTVGYTMDGEISLFTDNGDEIYLDTEAGVDISGTAITLTTVDGKTLTLSSLPTKV